MDLFEIKRINELDWEDIPFVEHPSFGFTRTFDAFNNPNNPWQRVINLREFIAAEFGNYDPIQHYAHTEDRLRDMMHDGHYLSICRTGKPFVAAFEWKENSAHPHNGEWIDAHRFFCGGRFIKLHLENITHQWHTRKARTFMDELMETPFALAKEKVQEYIPAPPRVSKRTAEKTEEEALLKTKEVPTATAPPINPFQDDPEILKSAEIATTKTNTAWKNGDSLRTKMTDTYNKWIKSDNYNGPDCKHWVNHFLAENGYKTFSGRANDMAVALSKQQQSVSLEEAVNSVNSGKVVIVAWENKSGTGHVALLKSGSGADINAVKLVQSSSAGRRAPHLTGTDVPLVGQRGAFRRSAVSDLKYYVVEK